MFGDVYLVSTKLSLTAPAPVLEHFEQEVGFAPPRGYCEFMSQLGSGTYCDQVSLFAPSEIPTRTNEWRSATHDHWFWQDRKGGLTQAEAQRCVVVGATMDGDRLVYNPADVTRVYALPRHDDEVHVLHAALEDPLSWGGSQTPAPRFRYFESDRDRAHVELFTAHRDVDVESVVLLFDKAWGSRGSHRIDDEECTLIFCRQVQGRIQLSRAPADGRIGIRVDYDIGAEAEIRDSVRRLAEMGFYVTFCSWTHA
jgi:hypothetical protein